MLFSGAVNSFRISNEVYHILIPAMVKALTELQTTYPYPPDPEFYKGEYSLIGVPRQPKLMLTLPLSKISCS